MIWKDQKYTVIEEIADNGSKAIYRCIDNLSGQTVIAKVLGAKASTYEAVMRIKKEYKMLSELKGVVEGVIRPIQLEERGGFFVLTLEDIDGQSLRNIIRDEQLELSTILRLAIKIVDIVGRIHEQQIIHKDLKPANLIWNRQSDQIQIIDFDLSVRLTNEKQEFQNAGLMEGTLSYISPEQTGRINRNIDYRSDFYSLGVVLYEMVTSQKPYPSDSVAEQLYSIIAKKPNSPYDITQGQVSRPLSDIIMKLLEKSPEDRYRSAYGIKADLRKCYDPQAAFQIGHEDRLSLFHIPQRLHGRDQELARMREILTKGIKEQVQLALVSGEAGIGKTAFVNELHSFISKERGYFIQGKFEQYNKNIPYSAIIQAFRTLLVQYLKGLPEEMQQLQSALRNGLGNNAGVITKWLPELEQILGIQPMVEPLNPTEENNRFFLSFIRFLEGLTAGQRPLILFLDDLQWADVSSIQLVGRLMESSSLKKLFIIGSYRPNEVNPGHPLMTALEEIEKQMTIHHIQLTSLSAEHVQYLIEDTLNTTNVNIIEPLRENIYHQTKGNPFFIHEILKDLYKNKAIFFDDQLGTWNLNQTQVKQMTMNEDLIDYLIQKMQTLPVHMQRILGLAASIGRSFDWQILHLVSDATTTVIIESLMQAVQEDIITPLHSNYQMLSSTEEVSPELKQLDIPFAFGHDKLQQALYQMIDPQSRQSLHLQIGWLLLDHWSVDKVRENSMDIAGHLNKGVSLVNSVEERERMITINLQAAKRAKESFGYEIACQFLETALHLLGSNSWTTHYQTTFDIYYLYSECSYLIHQLESGDQACRALIEHVQIPMELAKIYEMQSNHYMYLGMMKEAIEAGKLGLASLGVYVPAKLNMAIVGKEIIRVKLKLRGKSTHELLHGPEVQDEKIKLVMRLLVSFIPPAFISGEQTLFAWAVLKKAYLSIQYGNGPESAGAYIGYAMLLSGMGDLKGAQEYGKLAIDINEKFNDLQWRSLVKVLYTLFCYSWSHEWELLEEQYSQAIDSSILSGDMLYLAHACYYMNLWNPALEIEKYLQESDQMISMIENTKYKEALATAQLSRQKFRILAGELKQTDSFNDESFSEQAYLAQLTEANYYSGIAIYYINKIQIAFIFENYRESLSYIDKAYKVVSTLAGSTFLEEFSFYTFMNLAACYDDLGVGEKQTARLRMRKEYRRMRKWAIHFPHNFLPQQHMMKAEWLRINRKYKEAEKYYHLALSASGHGNFTRYKAIASEQIARFYTSRALNEIAAYFFKQASYYYSVWGAKAKVQHLEKRYQDLMYHVQWIPSHTENTLTSSTENIDIHLLFKASQIISKEIELDQLLQKIMEVVIMNAGAERGCMIMQSNFSLWVEGEYKHNENRIEVLLHHEQHREHQQHFPWEIIDYVAKSGQILLHSDARSGIGLAAYSYIAEHQPKSMLCMPLYNQNKLIAIIYLENNLMTGAFTNERLKMINLLSRDMVYSIENASLYANMENLVAERTEELAIKNEQLSKYFNIVDKNVIIVQTNLYDEITMVSEEFCIMTGYSREELIGKKHRFLYAKDRREGSYQVFVMNEEKTWTGELIQPKKDESLLWLDMIIEPILNHNQITGYTFIGHNITDKKQIERISIIDDLTGLYNRRHFNDRIVHKILKAAKEQKGLAFMLLDIDHYKKYNDTYGHYEGDHVLRMIGSTLTAQMRKRTDMAFRLGGEEFAILHISTGVEEAYEFAESLRACIEDLHIPHTQNDASPYITVSVGLAVVTAVDDELTEEKIYRLADEALYRSKTKGRNCVTINVL